MCVCFVHIICLNDAMRQIESEVMASELCCRMDKGHQGTESGKAFHSGTQDIIFCSKQTKRKQSFQYHGRQLCAHFVSMPVRVYLLRLSTFSYVVSQCMGADMMPRLIEFSGVVQSCFTLSRSTVFTGFSSGQFLD